MSSAEGRPEWVAPATPSMRDIVVEAVSEEGQTSFYDGAAEEEALMERWITVDDGDVVDLEEVR